MELPASAADVTTLFQQYNATIVTALAQAATARSSLIVANATIARLNITGYLAQLP
jgi:hypothetical protein